MLQVALVIINVGHKAKASAMTVVALVSTSISASNGLSALALFGH